MSITLFKRRFTLGFFRHGNCWRWRFARRDYFDGKVTWFTFWRLSLSIDRTFA